ncbi:MAG TPA: hypothetical protein VL547_07645 [Dinghuibacter sp.]|uniref:hypothetical protein n=1 Tax=Dinghuibacter sp. TaxID=2024697 RepID=UPI002C66DBAF|nr:hypothetical protein [Dinghuibacter sp.]HTJ11881.1 hypothetical protein [Dinghuibacter sp.]
MNTVTLKETDTLRKMEAQLDAVLRYMEDAGRSQQQTIEQLQHKLADCRRHNEGQQQLINKLLSDIDRYQLDIDWYRRTYEKRTFLGVIKEKLFRK